MNWEKQQLRQLHVFVISKINVLSYHSCEGKFYFWDKRKRFALLFQLSYSYTFFNSLIFKICHKKRKCSGWYPSSVFIFLCWLVKTFLINYFLQPGLGKCCIRHLLKRSIAHSKNFHIGYRYEPHYDDFPFSLLLGRCGRTRSWRYRKIVSSPIYRN